MSLVNQAQVPTEVVNCAPYPGSNGSVRRSCVVCHPPRVLAVVPCVRLSMTGGSEKSVKSCLINSATNSVGFPFSTSSGMPISLVLLQRDLPSRSLSLNVSILFYLCKVFREFSKEKIRASLSFVCQSTALILSFNSCCVTCIT